MTSRTTYMDDFRSSPSNRPYGKCCSNYYQSSPITYKSKREEHELFPYRQSTSKYNSCDGSCHSANINNPYNNLHCRCHECQRYMKCSDAKWKFEKNFPIICTIRDDELPNFYKMMAQKNRFKTTYRDSYDKKYTYPDRYPDSYPDKYHPIKCHSVREDDLCYPIQTEIYPKPQPTQKLGNHPAYQIEARKNDKVYDGGIISRPWRSEYMDGISRTGQRILKEKLLVNKPIGLPKLP